MKEWMLLQDILGNKIDSLGEELGNKIDVLGEGLGNG
jgi:hypothetical protein